MAKLSAPQDKAIRGLSRGEFPMSTNGRTITALVNGGYVTEDNTFYDLTTKGREYLGVDKAAEEIQELLNAPHGTLPCDQSEKPFAVQQLMGNVWQTVGRVAATWGTANVWRNRMASRGLIVRVHNTVTDQVWA